MQNQTETADDSNLNRDKTLESMLSFLEKIAKRQEEMANGQKEMAKSQKEMAKSLEILKEIKSIHTKLYSN